MEEDGRKGRSLELSGSAGVVDEMDFFAKEEKERARPASATDHGVPHLGLKKEDPAAVNVSDPILFVCCHSLSRLVVLVV